MVLLTMLTIENEIDIRYYVKHGLVFASNSADAIGAKAHLNRCLLYIIPLCHVLP